MEDQQQNSCVWTQLDPMDYQTSCEHALSLDGTPAEFEYSFCPYCGKPLQAVLLSQFKKGDQVSWTSQAGSYAKSKTGTVVAVVYPGIDPKHELFLASHEIYGLPRRFDGWPRKEISYLVAVRSGKTEKSSLALYWPRANNLKAA